MWRSEEYHSYQTRAGHNIITRSDHSTMMGMVAGRQSFQPDKWRDSE